MGVADESDEKGRRRFDAVLSDPAWMLLVADFAGGLLGYAAMQDRGLHLCGDEHRTWRLHDMFVRPKRRRQGVGRALMWAVTKAARDGGAVHLKWQAHGSHSAPFYERLGFKGEASPQPEYPTFEVTFTSEGESGSEP
jgi:GNAT superfamily N-acetyltransferase